MLSYVRDRFLNIRLTRDEKEIKIGFAATALIILALLVNITYLNLFILNSSSNRSYAPITTVETPAPNLSPSSTPSASPVPVQSIPVQTSQNTVQGEKDYYLNLGSGTNQSTDWTDVAGTFNTFDISQYPNIKEVHLETTTDVPTANGTISVRLFNKTDGDAVWNSERTVQAQSNGDLLISQNMIYPQGPKLYSVQMKSQLGVLANLIQARIHIITY